MAEEQTVDTSGITRSADGTISDGQVTQSDQSQASTSQETTKDGSTILTQEKKETVEAKTEEKKDEKSTVPEKYEDYKLPEGLTLDGETRSKADTLFKSLGLSQEGAQSLVDFYGEQVKAMAAAPVEAYKDLTAEWREASLNHPDLRGKIGPGQDINVRISRALDAIGDSKLVSDFKAHMDLTGAGSHQAFIRVLDYFAKKVTEGTHVAGTNPSPLGQSKPGSDAKPSAATAMWPNLASR